MVKYWKGFEYRVRDILRKIFKMPGIERVPLSGRLGKKYLGTKGDLMNFPACVEIKSTTNKKSIRIKKEWLDKLIAQARNEQKLPLLIFGFHGAREIYAIIPMREWMRKIEIDNSIEIKKSIQGSSYRGPMMITVRNGIPYCPNCGEPYDRIDYISFEGQEVSVERYHHKLECYFCDKSQWISQLDAESLDLPLK